MRVRVNAEDLASRGLVIITPDDAASAELYARLEMSEGLDSIRTRSAFIRNTGKQSVVAFMLKWELMKPSGEIDARNYQYVTNWSLMGGGVSRHGGDIIRPETTWFITPGFATEVGNDHGYLPAGRDMLLKRIDRDLSQYSSLTVSLDGAFFEDGTFVGPNSTGFFEKVAALCEAHRDLSTEIAADVDAGKADDEIFRGLETLAAAPKGAFRKHSSPEDYYNRFKSDYAEQLVRMRGKSGDKQTLEFARRPLNKPWPTLRKEASKF
jgi:hypothetical protein